MASVDAENMSKTRLTKSHDDRRKTVAHGQVEVHLLVLVFACKARNAARGDELQVTTDAHRGGGESDRSTNGELGGFAMK